MAVAPHRRAGVVAGALSMLVPGAGQLYAGARRRGLVLLAAWSALVLVLLALAALRPLEVAGSIVDRRVVAAALLVNLGLLVFRLFAVVDAWRRGRTAASWAAAVALVVLVALTAVPHVAAAYVAVRGYGVLESVFAEEEPHDVLPARAGVFLDPAASVPVPTLRQLWPGGLDPAENLPASVPVRPDEDARLRSSRAVLAGSRLARPWVTVLLLGTDEGPGNFGARTDTMIVVALQRGTGRAAAFGVPRNLVGVPLPGPAGRGELKRFDEPLNALYSFGRERPELFPGGRDPGATALKQTISKLLGIRVDYHALVNLEGFADMVDALGGVDVRVKERLVDEVTRPAWGEPKPTIDVVPGRTYHFFGREALAYVRSRKASNDYTRMARQRCFLSAMAQQLDVVGVLRHFGALASSIEASVHTDIPLRRLPDLMRLAAGIDPDETLTETFGLEYIARRRTSDRFPIANIAKIRATVRDTILHGRVAGGRQAESVAKAC